MFLGYNYRAMGEYSSAVEAFSEANSLNPGDSIPIWKLSRTYLEYGDFGKAVQYAESAVKDDPENRTGMGNLGLRIIRTGNTINRSGLSSWQLREAPPKMAQW